MNSKQLIVISDMEGASGIFDSNAQAKAHGSESWREYGRLCMTSDVIAVFEAAHACGINDILYYDGHFAGNAEHNVLLQRLPPYVRLFDVPDRCFDWRRIRGQAAQQPFGLITVGQHARYGTPNAYFAHTIQSPPIRAIYANGLHIAEIGQAVLSFSGVRYLANIGCAASHAEALELSETVTTVTVKDKAKGFEPSADETRAIIRAGVKTALGNAMLKKSVSMDGPVALRMDLCDG